MQVVFEAEYDSQSGLFGLDNLVFGTEKKCIPRWEFHDNFVSASNEFSNLIIPLLCNEKHVP